MKTEISMGPSKSINLEIALVVTRLNRWDHDALNAISFSNLRMMSTIVEPSTSAMMENMSIKWSWMARNNQSQKRFLNWLEKFLLLTSMENVLLININSQWSQTCSAI